jgi:tetratricopeptide (TPR) repeat protein
VALDITVAIATIIGTVLAAVAVAVAIIQVRDARRQQEEYRGAVADQAAQKPPTLKPLRMELLQLPSDVPDFTGRTETLDHLEHLMARHRERRMTGVTILVITGTAGVGKTALAVRAAHHMRPHFPDGQLYVNLRGAEAQALDPDQVLGDFLHVLGLEGAAIPSDSEARMQLYRSRLADRRVLVLLDNARDEAQVRPLLPGSSACPVIVTSRSPLAGLEGARFVPLGVLESDQALELLAKVVGAERVAAEHEAAQRIVKLCGCLPLAVRIAGAKLASRPHWRLARLADRLADEQRRLDELRAGDLEVRSSFMLSYEGLSEEEQRAFRLLGLLDAPDFAVWVAAALLDRSPVDAEALIDRLVDAQLVQGLGEDATGQMRYRLHDLLRDFAREHLRSEETPQDRKAVLGRLLGAYLAVAEEAEALLEPGSLRKIEGGTAGRWPSGTSALSALGLHAPLAWFVAERANTVIIQKQAYDAEAWEFAWEIAGCLVTFFERGGYWTDWRHTHELALAAARRAGNRRGEAETLRNLGVVYRNLGHWDDAIGCFNKSAEILREIRDSRGEARSVGEIGNVYRDQGRWDDAEGYFRRSLIALRQADDRIWEAYILRVLGIVYRYQGRWEDAMACYSQCLPFFRELGNRRWEAYTLSEIGILHRDQGHWHDAVEHFNQSLEIFRDVGDRLWEAYTIRSLGDLYRDQRRWDDAITCFNQCLPVFRDVGDRVWEAYTLRSLGIAYRGKGRWDDAMTCLNQSLRTFGDLSDERWEARTLHSLGEVHTDLGRWEEAFAAFQRSLEVFRRLDDRLWEARTLASLGRAHESSGDPTNARAAWRDALTTYRSIHSPEAAQVEVWLELGHS